MLFIIITALNNSNYMVIDLFKYINKEIG